MNTTGFSIGTLPMRYLGLPLTSKKWNFFECDQLVERLQRGLTLVILNSFFMLIDCKLLMLSSFQYIISEELYSYFHSVIKEIDKKCKEYLWGSTEGNMKLALEAWDAICRPKKLGGLNIKGCKLWNVAAVGKLLWQLVTNKEVLWVRWVHDIYMKTCRNIWDHQPPTDYS